MVGDAVGATVEVGVDDAVGTNANVTVGDAVGVRVEVGVGDAVGVGVGVGSSVAIAGNGSIESSEQATIENPTAAANITETDGLENPLRRRSFIPQTMISI